jgi:hypothetical protein
MLNSECKGSGFMQATAILHPHWQVDNFLDRCKNWQDGTHARAWALLVAFALDEDDASGDSEDSPGEEKSTLAHTAD